MPREFVGAIDTPTNLEFGADELVDSTNRFEGIEEAAKTLSDLTGSLVLRGLENDQLAEIAGEESLYEDIRRKKRQVYEAAQAGDDAAVKQFSQELEELTIAERQGAISGTNSSVRKESLLRSYINRFPHREEEIRQQYSALRRAYQESRASRVSDPIEDGINDAIKAATSKGISLTRELDMRQKTAEFEMWKQSAEERTSVGLMYEGEFEAQIDRNYMSLAYQDAASYIQKVTEAIEAGQDIDAVTIQRNLAAMREGAKMMLSSHINDIVARSPAPDAVLNREFRAAQANKIDEMYNGFIQYAENLDTLQAYARGLTYRQNATIEDLRNVDPMMRTLIDIGAPEAAGKFLTENWANTQRVFIVGGAANVRALRDNAPNPAEKARYNVQLRMLEEYGGQQAADDLRTILENGSPPTQTGDPYVDAAILNTHTQAIFQSPDMEQDHKDNAVNAILEAEKQDSGYLTPGEHWYKDPVKRRQLSSSEVSKERMRTQLVSAAPGVIREIQANPTMSESLSFAPNIEKDRTLTKPWMNYPSGGPWSWIDAQQNAQDAIKQSPLSSAAPGLGGFVQLSNADTKKIITALNNMYWLTRMIDGPQLAEQQAEEIFTLLTSEGEEDGTEEGEQPSGEADDGTPIFDLTD